MKKTIALLLCVLMLATCFSACGDNENNEDSQQNTATGEISTTGNSSDSQTTAPDTSETESVTGDSEKDWTLNY